MAEYPTNVLIDAVCGFASAEGFEAFQADENLWRSDFLDLSIADPRKDVTLEASDDVVRIAVCPAAFMAAVPFARDGFKGIGAGVFLGLAFKAGVDAVK
jgi:hypothetical protein